LDTKILRLDEIIVDNSLNPRVGALDQETVLDYSAHVDDLPSMTVFDGRNWPENPGLYLVGGFHRFAAHQLAGRDVAKFIVRQGSREAAEEAADLDNLTHGLHLTRAEKREVVKRYLRRHPNRSNVWVGKECRVNDKTVATIRLELEERSEIPRLDRLVDRDGIERPRNIERPQKPDADEEARKLTQPLPLPPTPLEKAIERAGVETPDDPRVTRFKAQPCPDCQGEEFYWLNPETVSCYICGRKWDKLAWLGRHAPAGVESRAAAIEAAETDGAVTWKDLGTDGAWRDGRGAKAIRPPDWAALGTDGKWYNRDPDGKPDYDAPVRKGAFPAPPWYLEMFSLTVPAPQPTEESQASSEPDAGQAEDEMPEWLKEDETEAGETESAPETEAPKAEWGNPVKEFKSAAPPVSLEAKLAKAGAAEAKSDPAPVAPPPPPPPVPAKVVPPPPPPPTVGRAPLIVSITVYPNGNALLTAAASSDFRRDLSGPGVEMAANVERLIEIYLREETVKEEPVNDNAI
jgi:hypothetical protein